jgi:UDP-N-acetyl-D-galactosamine dehydrogenase
MSKKINAFFGVNVLVNESVADKEKVCGEYRIELVNKDALRDLNCIVLNE